LARPGKRLREGTRISFGEGEVEAEILEKRERGEVLLDLRCREGGRLEDLIERIGEIPLPPYIHHKLEDNERYQTVFASRPGSAAAPTAGLHFEEDDLRRLADTGVKLARIDLEIGMDTFRPMQTERVEEHRMHSEAFCVGEEACRVINSARQEGGRVVAVGTTVVRALESCPRGAEVVPFAGDTGLFIYPGFGFRFVDCLLTNFHMPRSSLLALVCAFAGRDLVLQAYAQAVDLGYRFLSFGDACFFHYPDGRNNR
jgi:S-adenosylmethionine:tRNA ribosyltransferase-isomerase